MINLRPALASALFVLSPLCAVAQTQIAVLPYYIDDSKKNSVRVFVHETTVEYSACAEIVSGKDQIEQAIDIFVNMFRKRNETFRDLAQAHMVRVGQIGDLVIYAINLDKYTGPRNDISKYMYPKYSSIGLNALIAKAQKEKELFGKEIEAVLQEVVLFDEVTQFFAR